MSQEMSNGLIMVSIKKEVLNYIDSNSYNYRFSIKEF